MKVYRRRYVYIVVEEDNFDEKEVLREVRNSFKLLFGEVSLSLCDLRLVRRFDNGLILSINSKFLDKLICSLIMVGRLKERQALHVSAISTTIKSLMRRIQELIEVEKQ